MGLLPAEAAMRTHQVLEGRYLLRLRVPHRVDHDVGAMRVGVCLQNLPPGRRTERLQRIFTVHDLCLQGVEPVVADHDRAELVRTHEDESDSGMAGERGHEVRVPRADYL